MTKIIFEAKKIRQEIETKLNNLTSRNAKLWLSDSVEKMSEKSATLDERYRGVAASLKLYVRFPSEKFASNRNLLMKALKVCDSLLIPTQEKDDLRYTLEIHLGNLHVSNNLFFEALDFFHGAYRREALRERRIVCLLNMARCKLWLRDFRGVAALTKQVEGLGITDPEIMPFLWSIKTRLALLLGNSENFSKKRNHDFDIEIAATIETKYLLMISTIMGEWETSIAAKYEQFLDDKTMNFSKEELSFYRFEGLVLRILQDMKRGRSISVSTTRRLASLKQKVQEYELQECAKVLLLLQKTEKASTGRQLSLHHRMSTVLQQLLSGANDFMYQFASVLWMEYLWDKNQKTEFARYFIEFKSYAEKLYFELKAANSNESWLSRKLLEYEGKYRKLEVKLFDDEL